MIEVAGLIIMLFSADLLDAAANVQESPAAPKAASAATAPSTEVQRDKSVEAATESQSDSAEKQTTVRSQIIIIGPDGKRQEYNIGETLPKGFDLLPAPLNMPGKSDSQNPGESAPGNEEPRYMIGVVCVPLDIVMQRHLKIVGKGLLVQGVSENLPAAQAGIAAGDILLSVNQHPLTEVADLVNATEQSEGKELTFELLHEGDSVTFMVVPKLMSLTDAMKSMPQPDQPADLDDFFVYPKSGVAGKNSSSRMIIHSFGPALQLPDSKNSEPEKLLNERLSRMFPDGSISNPAKPSREQLQKQLEEMRIRMNEMENQLSKLKSETTAD